MISLSAYLSSDFNANKACELLELSMDELESIVGRFKKGSKRAGQLRGMIVIYSDDSVEIRHHFTKKVLWKQEI